MSARAVVVAVTLAALASCDGPRSRSSVEAAGGHSSGYALETEPAAAPAQSSLLRILPLGDSITSGFDEERPRCGSGSYRRPLWRMLSEAGKAVDFVGSQPDPCEEAVPGGWDFDHEGRWGYRLDDVLPDLVDRARAADPDVVLVHLGTNDVTWGGESLDEDVAELGRVVSQLRSVDPGVRVLVAQLIPSVNVDVGPFNERVAQLGAAEGFHVVDMFSGYDLAWNPDGEHPGGRGDHELAARWLAALAL